MLHLVEEDLTYEVGGAVFHYQRLVHSDMSKLRYLANIRGLFDQAMYDTACVATALRGWEGLAGKDGLIPYPLVLPASAITETDQQVIDSLHLLTPTLTREERMQLHGAFYVVTHLPLDIMSALIEKVRELSPESLEKKYERMWNGDLSGNSPLTVPILPVRSVDEMSRDGRLATVEA